MWPLSTQEAASVDRELNFSFLQMHFVASVETSTALEYGLPEIHTDASHNLFHRYS